MIYKIFKCLWTMKLSIYKLTKVMLNLCFISCSSTFFHTNSCQISNNLIFISALKTESNNLEKVFFYSSENSGILKIKDSGFEPRYMSGTVFCKFEIFLFGGCKLGGVENNELECNEEYYGDLNDKNLWVSLACKYNLINKEWVRISNLPVASEVSSILMDKTFNFNVKDSIEKSFSINSENLILLTGFRMTKVFTYSPNRDKYEELESVFEANKYKTLLKHQNKTFLLYNKTISLQKPSKSTWKKIGFFTFLKDCHITHQITRKDCIIFTNNTQIWSFNTNSIEIIELQPPQTHYVFHTNTHSPYKKSKISLT